MVLRVVDVGLGLAAALVVSTLTTTGCARTAAVTAPTVIRVEPVAGAGLAETGFSRAPVASSWNAKDEVDVEWHGSWWPAMVMEKRGQNRWLVHYQGYGDDWDEVVGGERIRERRARSDAEVEEERKDDAQDP